MLDYKLTNAQIKRLCDEDVWNATLITSFPNEGYYVFKQKKQPSNKANWYEYRISTLSGWYGRFECGPVTEDGIVRPDATLRALPHKVKHIMKLYEILYNK